jgi:hypothetical protein
MIGNSKVQTLAGRTLLVGGILLLSGCAAMLPKTKVVTHSPWQTYQEVQAVFDGIEPYKTTAVDLKELNLDPEINPNITILNYSDVLRRFAPGPSVSAKSIDTAVLECIEAKTSCRGYEIDQRYMTRNRNGEFWMDFLNFRRKVDIEGYKLTGGQPSIRETEETRNPMGPLQGRGEGLLGRFFF